MGAEPTSLTSPSVPPPLPNTWQSISVTFKSSDNFSFGQYVQTDPDSVEVYTFVLNSTSISGSFFSGLIIEDPSAKPAWSPLKPSGNTYCNLCTAPGIANFWVTIQPNLISVTIQSIASPGTTNTLCLKVQVTDLGGVQHTSPDPQIVLKPR